jgi:GDP-L-fucose synthase
MKEEYLLSGYLEPTNEPYAVAKIAGIKLCESFNRQYGTKYRTVMPTNLYGPRDNFDLQSSHVLPAMIRKFHLAKLALDKDWNGIQKDEAVHGPIPGDIKAFLGLDRTAHQPVEQSANRPFIILWGTGTPRREFLHVDDMAAACLFVMQLSDNQFESALCSPANCDDSFSAKKNDNYPSPISHLNIGRGKDMTVRDLADLVKNIVNYQGDVFWDSSKPDGMRLKLLDISRLSTLGWRPRIELELGIRQTYDWYKRQI